MQSYFFAMLHRMRYIQRWSLMRNSQEENLQEHSLEVAYLAHALALIRREILHLRPEVSPERCVMLALYHDISEIITGDLPTPIKYFNEQINTSFKEVENEALGLMLKGLPEELAKCYKGYIFQENFPKDAKNSTLSPVQLEAKIVKAADTLSAYIKCLDEKAFGNYEFKDAEESTLAKLNSYKLPELDWFIEHCLPDFSLTLDELRNSDNSR